MPKFLAHTDLTRVVDFQERSNNLAFERMMKKKEEHKLEYGFTNSKFSKFLGFFNHEDTNKCLQMCHFWRWAKAQVGVKREYTYDCMGETITETLILVGIKNHKEGLVFVYKTKTGKKEWMESVIGSSFYGHWYLANKKAGKI